MSDEPGTRQAAAEAATAPAGGENLQPEGPARPRRGAFRQDRASVRRRHLGAQERHVVSGRSIMGLMMLAAASGAELQISAAGPEADSAVETLARLVECKFDEDC